MQLSIAYLARGQLRLKEGTGPARNLESRYGETIREKLLKSQQRHAWKSGGGGFLASEMLWGKAGLGNRPIPVNLTSLCSGNVAGHLLYTLESESLCGLLSVENSGENERRLWNNNNIKIRHLSLSSNGDLACGIENQNGTANIGVMLYENAGLREITEGDSFDTAPSWIPGQERELVFQSAGVGRTKDGHVAGLGPFHIQKLVLATGDMSTLLEDSQFDFLAPRAASSGVLYCIQRPHQTGREFKPLAVIKDILLLPFRLIWAVFQFLNFFSMLFGSKKLTPSANVPAQMKQMDPKQMILWGNLIQAQKENADGKAQTIVPSTWKLIRKEPGKDVEILAQSVACFDVAADGVIVFSDGTKIVSLQNGKETVLGSDELVEQIAILPTP